MTVPTVSPYRRSVIHATLAAALAASVLFVPTAASAETDDSGLEQTIDEGQEVVDGERVLSAGHVDMGPRLIDGTWTFLIHDDVAKADASARSVWRYPESTVFHILDEGMLTVPDDAAYEFLGGAPGSSVWVSPQTQNPDVVWLGWNTQDPAVMAEIDRGVTLTLHGVEGPGVMTTFLQSGSFGEPQVLWDSRIDEPQPIWVDVNTHTHANWTFTDTGIYLIELEASAELIDGSTVSDTQVLRVAVGTSTDPHSAFRAELSGGSASSDGAIDSTDDDIATNDRPSESEPSDTLVPILVAAIAIVAVGLLTGTIVVAVRGGRDRRRALALRGLDASRDPDGSGDGESSR
ncbi:choice-of-anchor M domain-containing protein [Agromyces atrinae]|uniref:choice-of-anchor M domain-containing protein n=1 Tax=Agromyces atrinae TaxID=592376 RepID=UPI001F570D5E|nr:choice-of-anchor M domain-containing protein [Agromyces atrinae]MCI2956659.1 choice-of-anchor M domain-containing protein [Agromyces atrinae]